MRISRRYLGMAMLMIYVLSACAGNGPTAVTPEEAETTARQAYVWGFPMVMGYKTLYNYVIDTANPEYKGPFNQVACEARLFTPDDKAVVTPNADTPYCMFWLDLRAEPVVLSVPEMEAERFYHFQLIDLYTHNFAYVGTLTTGNGAGSFLIAGPEWDGEVPEGIDDVLRSETNFVFVVTRTQLFGSDDLGRVEEIQGEYELRPLSEVSGRDAPPAPPPLEFPDWEEGSQFDERFFGYLDFMMTLLEEPVQGKQELWQSLSRLGIGPSGDFDFAALEPEIREAMKAGREAGFAVIEAFVAKHADDPLISGKLFGTRAFLEESAAANFESDDIDVLRSVAAHMGIYGNSAAEAIYPTFLTDAGGSPLDGSAHRYSLTFPEGELPPVGAFWSLSMYDGATQLFIDNPIDRYLLNSAMMDDFRMGDDGSLMLLIQQDSPGEGWDSNWLPAPEGPFYLVMRLYGPDQQVLEGSWSPPPVVRAE